MQVLNRFRSFWLLGLVLLGLGVAAPTQAQQVAVSDKVAEKIQKVIVNTILETLKTTDQDLYLAMRGFWETIRTGNTRPAMLFLRDFLARKGTTYFIVHTPALKNLWRGWIIDIFINGAAGIGLEINEDMAESQLDTVLRQAIGMGLNEFDERVDRVIEELVSFVVTFAFSPDTADFETAAGNYFRHTAEFLNDISPEFPRTIRSFADFDTQFDNVASKIELLLTGVVDQYGAAIDQRIEELERVSTHAARASEVMSNYLRTYPSLSVEAAERLLSLNEQFESRTRRAIVEGFNENKPGAPTYDRTMFPERLQGILRELNAYLANQVVVVYDGTEIPLLTLGYVKGHASYMGRIGGSSPRQRIGINYSTDNGFADKLLFPNYGPDIDLYALADPKLTFADAGLGAVFNDLINAEKNSKDALLPVWALTTDGLNMGSRTDANGVEKDWTYYMLQRFCRDFEIDSDDGLEAAAARYYDYSRAYENTEPEDQAQRNRDKLAEAAKKQRALCLAEKPFEFLPAEIEALEAAFSETKIRQIFRHLTDYSYAYRFTQAIQSLNYDAWLTNKVDYGYLHDVSTGATDTLPLLYQAYGQPHSLFLNRRIEDYERSLLLFDEDYFTAFDDYETEVETVEAAIQDGLVNSKEDFDRIYRGIWEYFNSIVWGRIRDDAVRQYQPMYFRGAEKIRTMLVRSFKAVTDQTLGFEGRDLFCEGGSAGGSLEVSVDIEGYIAAEFPMLAGNAELVDGIESFLEENLPEFMGSADFDLCTQYQVSYGRRRDVFELTSDRLTRDMRADFLQSTIDYIQERGQGGQPNPDYVYEYPGEGEERQRLLTDLGMSIHNIDQWVPAMSALYVEPFDEISVEARAQITALREMKIALSSRYVDANYKNQVELLLKTMPATRGVAGFIQPFMELKAQVEDAVAEFARDRSFYGLFSRSLESFLPPSLSSSARTQINQILNPAVQSVLRVVAIMVDFIISRDGDQLKNNFLDLVRTDLFSFFDLNTILAGQTTAEIDPSRPPGPGLSLRMVLLVLAYYFDAISISDLGNEVASIIKNYLPDDVANAVGNAIQGNAPNPDEILSSLRINLSRSALNRVPIITSLITGIAEVLIKEGDFQAIARYLEEYSTQFLEEIIDFIKNSEAARSISDRLNLRFELLGTSVEALLRIVVQQDITQLKTLVGGYFENALDRQLDYLDETLQAIIRPIVTVAIEYFLYDVEYTPEQLVAVAIEILEKVATANRGFYLGVGIAIGGYYQLTGDYANASGASLGTLSIGQSPLFLNSGDRFTTRLILSDKLGWDIIGTFDPTSPFRFGPYFGGVLDFVLTNFLNLDGAASEAEQNQSGTPFLRFGMFVGYEHPNNALLRFDFSMGAAFNFEFTRMDLFAELSYNVLELSDLL